MNHKIWQKIYTLFFGFSLILNSLNPMLQIAYAEEIAPTPEPTVVAQEEVAQGQDTSTTEEENTSTEDQTSVTPTDVPSETVTPKPDETSITPTPEDSATISLTPTPDNDLSPPSEDSDDDITIAPPITPSETPAPEKTGNEELSMLILDNVAVPSIDLDATVAEGSAVLKTDKDDYAPTDTVLLMGSGLVPNADYVLAIYSNDEPTVSFETGVKSDENGDFAYAYQLDGTYRPNYNADLKDASGEIVASTSFTDSPIFSAIEAQDIACMGGLTGLNCTANDIRIASVDNIQIIESGSDRNNLQPTTIQECEYPGQYIKFTATWHVEATATERYNVGLWFANEGQTSALYGMCSASTLPSSPTPFFEDTDDLCGDINSGAIGDVSPDITVIAQCNAAPGTDQLNMPYCTSWDNQEKAGNGCDGPEDALPGTPSKCNCEDGFTIPVTVPPGLEIIKNIDPTSDTGLFNLLVNGNVEKADAGHLGTTGKIGITTGSNTFGEVAGTGTSLSDYSYSASCVLRGTATSVDIGGPVEENGVIAWAIADVTNGQDIVCTITNTKLTGTITVNKTVVPSSDSGLFNLEIDGSAAGTGVDVGDGGTTGAVIVSTTAPHVVSESAGANTSLSNYTTSYSCDNDLSGSGTTIPAFSVAANDNVTCTFTNTKDAELTVHKVVINHGGSKTEADFAPYEVDATTVTLDTPTVFNTGSHTVTEITDPDYTAAFSGDCDQSGVVTLAAGDSKTCTITNEEKPARVIVHKVVVNHGLSYDSTHFAPYKVGATTVALDTETIMDSGVYDVTEVTDSNYTASFTGDCNASGNITLVPGTTKSCTITNEEKPAKLIVEKVVINDNGGTKVISDFPLFVDATGVTSGQINTFDSGAHVVSETSQPGYEGTIAGDCDRSGNVTLVPGETKTCVITNDDIAPTLKLVKEVTNDNGGDKTPADWTLSATGDGGFSDTGDSTTFHPVKAGVGYVLSESVVDGYDAGSWNCDNGTLVGDTLTLSLAENVVCTITNDDQAAHLIIIKNVINNNGGTKNAGDFSGTISGVTVSGGNTWVGTISPGVDKTLTSVGSYNVAENADPDYDTTYSPDCTGTIALGETKTCTVTNNDKAPALHLRKVVINDDGGIADATDWTLTATGASVSPTNLSGSTPVDSGSDFKADTYELAELNGPSGYTASAWDCRQASMSDATHVIVPLGADVTCAITNDDQAASITLIKNVISNNGGNAGPNDFGISVGGSFVTSGQANSVDSNTPYEINEVGLSGYSFVSLTGDAKCPSVLGGTVTLDSGESVTCTITNDDQAPALHLRKVIINDDGGSASATDWTLSANGPTPLSGTTPVDSGADFETGTYELSEVGPSGYTASAWDCGRAMTDPTHVNVPLGADVTCTITNDDIAPTLKLVKNVINDNGGSATAHDWTLTAKRLCANGDTSGTCIISNLGDEGTFQTARAGLMYILSESGPSGYTAGQWSCTGGTLSGNRLTLGINENVMCTIVNDDIAPTLRLVKEVVNDDGGKADAGDWDLTAARMCVNGSGDPTCNFTDKGDSNTFHTVLAGRVYKLTESGPSGYTAGNWSCDGGSLNGNSLTLGINENVTCTITNDDIAPTLRLVKEVVNDDGGKADAGDWDLTAARMCVNGSGDPTCNFTDKGDSNTFHTVLAGRVYKLTESGPSGYTAGNWSCDGGSLNGNSLTLSINENVTCTITNDDIAPTLKLVKNVINDNGGSATAHDWTLTAKRLCANGDTSGTCIISNLGDEGSFQKARAGLMYILSELGPSDYAAGAWSCTGGSLIGNKLTLGINEDVTCEITNDDQTGTLIVHKLQDTKGDGNYDTIDSADFTWGIEASSTPYAMGSAQTLLPGDYSVYESSVLGYQFVGWFFGSPNSESRYVCDDLPQENTQLPADISVLADTQTEITLCNQMQVPILTITKTNNVLGLDQHSGDTVIYTLTVTAMQNAVQGVTVTDLLPEGFAYQAGSWTAWSSERGDLKLLGVTTEPTYNSPGVWNLGDMEIGETVTLTLEAKISWDQQPGRYKDIAWAQGTAPSSQTVLALAMDPGNINPSDPDNNFVGTDVKVIKDQESGVSVTATEEVLGISTILPATGGESIWVAIALSAMGAGLSLAGIGYIIRRRYV